MARACVEDSCSVIAGNGVGNPNALRLTVPLDPAGGLSCTPGVGLGVNLALEPDGPTNCHNILHKSPSGALYVTQPGVNAYLMSSLGIVDVALVNGPSAAKVLLASSAQLFNPFTNCPALAIAHVNVQFDYVITAQDAFYWLQQTTTIVATYTGGGSPLIGAAANPSTHVHQLDENAKNGQGVGAEMSQQFDMTVGVALPIGASVQFDVFQKNPIIESGPAGNDASANIRHFPSQPPRAQADGFVIVMKDGVVN